MPVKLLWINKDQKSATLSSSNRAEEEQIRRHVQRKVREKRAKDATADVQPVLQPCVTRGLPSTLELALNGDERRSLDFFISKTAKDWPGWQDTFFWNALVLNACNEDPGIAHGLVALAALHESAVATSEISKQLALHDLAFRQWSKSTTVAMKGRLGYPMTLVSCVVLASVQDVLKNHQAFRLIRAGQDLLREMDSQPVNSPNQPTQAERMMIDTHIRPVIDRLNARICTHTGFPQSLFISAKNKSSKLDANTQPKIPLGFASLREARDSLEAILNWGQDHVYLASLNSMSLTRFKALLQNLLMAWSEASEQVTDFDSNNNQQVRCKKLLQVSCIFGKILLDTFNPDNECIYDQHLKEFQELAMLIEDVNDLKSLSYDRVFGIDCGLIDIIAFMGIKCRDPSIRMWALHFLFDSGRIEGDRVSFYGGRVLQELIKLEEQGCGEVNGCEDIPESNRRRTFGGFKQSHPREMCIIYIGAPYNVEAGARLEECRVDSNNLTTIRDIKSVSEAVDRTQPPEVYFGPACSGFLSDPETAAYCEFTLERFYFPIPRV